METASTGTGSTLTHLECSACGRRHDADSLQTLCPGIAAREGVFAAREGGAVRAGIKKLVAGGAIDRDERVVLMNTGTGLRYGELVSVDLPVVDRVQ